MKYVIVLSLLTQLFLPMIGLSGQAEETSVSTPSGAVLAYFEAYRHMNWAQAAGHTHPDSLVAFKNKILSILRQLDPKDRPELVREFGAQALNNLEAMQPAEFYVAAQRRRWGKGSVELPDAFSKANLTLLETKPLGDEGCVVTFQTQTVIGGSSVARTYQYLVRKHGNEWKVDLSDLITASGTEKR